MLAGDAGAPAMGARFTSGSFRPGTSSLTLMSAFDPKRTLPAFDILVRSLTGL